MEFEEKFKQGGIRASPGYSNGKVGAAASVRNKLVEFQGQKAEC